MKLLVDESVLRQVLVELNQIATPTQESEDMLFNAITSLRIALDTAENIKPVAWTTMPDASEWTFISGSQNPNGKLAGVWHPLYAAPVPSHTESKHWEAATKVLGRRLDELQKAARAAVEWYEKNDLDTELAEELRKLMK